MFKALVYIIDKFFRQSNETDIFLLPKSNVRVFFKVNMTSRVPFKLRDVIKIKKLAVTWSAVDFHSHLHINFRSASAVLRVLVKILLKIYIIKVKVWK